MSNDFHAVQALRRSECGLVRAVRCALAPRSLRARCSEEYAASVRRAFAPLGPCVLALACQAPASAPAPAGEQAPSGVNTAAFALKPGELVLPAQGSELPERAGDFDLDHHAPPVAYGEGVAKGRLTIEGMVDLLSTTPARRFGLASKGAIEVGRDADVVVFDPDADRTIRAADLHHTSDYTPFEGLAVRGAVRDVFVRGGRVVRDGTFVGTRGYGKPQVRSAIADV